MNNPGEQVQNPPETSENFHQLVGSEQNKLNSSNHGHNILRFFDVWLDFPFTTTETKHDD